MQYILALIFAPISLAFNLLTVILSPVIAVVPAAFNLRRPPFPWWLFYTHDDDIYGSKTTKEDVPEGLFNRWKRSIWWLCRNPGYGFDAYILGYGESDILSVKETYRIGEAFDDGNFNFVYYTIKLTKNRTRFSMRCDIPLFFDKRFIKTWIGWHYRTQAGRNMFKVDFNPFKKNRK